MLFLHWPVPAQALRPLLPARLEPDEHGGSGWVGVVAFALERVRPASWPEALAMDFLAAEVRTFVRREGGGEGTFCFSRDCTSRLAVLGARFRWGLPCVPAEGSLRARGQRIRYEVQRNGSGAPRLDVEFELAGPPAPVTPGSLEQFLLERRVVYVKSAAGLRRGRLRHAPHAIRPVRVHMARDELAAAAGLPCAGPPPHTCFSAGVDVELFAAEEL